MPKTKGSSMGGEREFDDVAEGAFTYAGDGKEQIEFFKNHSNVEDIINGMSFDDKDAIDSWAGGHMMYGQQYKGWDKMNNYDKKLTEIYDDVLDKSVLSHGVVVARLSDGQLLFGSGKEDGTIDEYRAMEGRTIISKGHMSTGVAKQGLAIGHRVKPVEYKIHIPSGAKGAGMWIGDGRINGWGERQREFMVNRDTAFRVGRTSYDFDRGVYVVHLHYTGRMKHDYGTSGRLPKNSLDYYNRNS